MSNGNSIYNRIAELCKQRYIKITPVLAKLDIATGESMSPDFHDGDIVLVKQQDNIDIGQIGIFTIDGVKYYRK